MKVLLLKEPKDKDSGPDPYIKELGSYSLEATLIPVLSFEFTSLDSLFDKLSHPECYGGLVFTSPRALEAIKICLKEKSKNEAWSKSLKQMWNIKPTYVVGKATASLVEEIGLIPQGEKTGNAEKLAEYICSREKPNSSALLFPCGALKREVLPTALREKGDPCQRRLLQPVRRQILPPAHPEAFRGFDQPSQAALLSLQFTAIGPSTAEALQDAGMAVSCTAESPTAQGLAAAIHRALQPHNCPVPH
ncbi:uroporphyrinogen-III synthase isoform X3 [Sylvia atricapilla]|uniref:uroporphyrinogen-III synthase isoform X3 n=1 Tax=Sylvia atricapilla TaxID=48155 RepID=UPI0033909563